MPNQCMKKMIDVGILDYTPLNYTKYDEQLTARIIKEMLSEAVYGADLFSHILFNCRHIRCFKEEYHFDEKDFQLLIIAGSPLPTTENSRELQKALAQIESLLSSVPTLGICFGLHAIAKVVGNESKKIIQFEIGPREVLLYEDIDEVGKAGDILLFPVNHAYKISISNGNDKIRVLATSNGGIQIVDATECFGGNPVIGFQFHPEFAASHNGWKTFKRIYEATLMRIINDTVEDVSLEPIISNLKKPVLKRLKETIADPNQLIGKKLTHEQRDLLMSPFHNIDYRPKLLGKTESVRTYEELKKNSCAAVRYFLKKAILRKDTDSFRKRKRENERQLKLSI
ncbi:MAG: hypothetical protein QXT05_00355 [Candidatus Bilamarchaeaceae archaeon]